jgi:UDP-GlcNAc3NAcA epimerase
MLILSVVGARPQFVKAAVVSRALRRTHQERLIHTGQHYDDDMSGVFFRELGLPLPDVDLGVGSGSHGEQTARILEGIEAVLQRERPALVLVYGDTNSTLAAALAAVKLGIPVAHVEAGCRSYDRSMPEEINRVLTDHMSRLLFCVTEGNIATLAGEGITRGVHRVGDVMLDVLTEARARIEAVDGVLADHALTPGRYVVATIHRPSNTDDPARLAAILDAFADLDEPVVFPVHPRTRKAIDALDGRPRPSVRLLPPVGYHDMLRLTRHARLVLTDSGGLQKEAFYLGTPCLTLRDTTEWTETVEAGWNRLVAIDRETIVATARSWKPTGVPKHEPFGDGHAAERIVTIISELAA